jgi:hypothetical protein
VRLVPLRLGHVSHQRLISEIALLSDCPDKCSGSILLMWLCNIRRMPLIFIIFLLCTCVCVFCKFMRDKCCSVEHTATSCARSDTESHLSIPLCSLARSRNSILFELIYVSFSAEIKIILVFPNSCNLIFYFNWSKYLTGLYRYDLELYLSL